MNDTELDEMLDQWEMMSTPPDSLREDVRSAFRERPVRRKWSFSPNAWRGVFAGVAVAAVLFLAVITTAYSQTTLWFAIQLDRPSWLIESNKLFYKPDGSAPNQYHVTDVLVDGQRIALSDDGDDLPPWRKELLGVESVFGSLMLQVAPSTAIQKMSPAGEAAWRRFVATGCVANPADPATLASHETVLGHATTVNQSTMFDVVPAGLRMQRPRVRGPRIRMTSWMAPDLDCAIVKSKFEREGPDGRLHLVSETVPVKITANAMRRGSASKK